MLQLFFTVAFSVVPLTLYIPPIRSLNLFVETMESVMRESTTYSNRIYPRLRIAWSRMLNCLLCNNTSFVLIFVYDLII
ncbi:DIS3-exonuclease-like protein [Medicago truncatula]|uniref:DIS3-exonuclease-like protein n=1 Tax=Medicago truncatula TaxID=3880 RepID=G7LDN6_MEDTR|nr:DIS3-exonuclease-like protein [Medicago truncatula]